MEYTILKIGCFQLAFLVLLTIIACNKNAGKSEVKNDMETQGKIHRDSFTYQLEIYNANGRVSIYKLTSAKPLTKYDSNLFMLQSLKAERKDSMP